MTLRKDSARVASVGVTRTQLAVQEGLDWLFREQPTEDYGIDAHAEVVDGQDVRGRLLAMQIKSGDSQFVEPGPDGWWFRPDVEHVRYWTNHSLPVVIVLYDPETKLCHWELVNRETLVPTKTGGWKVLVPRAHVLDESAREPLRKAAEGDPYVLRIRELQLAKPWMEMLAAGARLVVDMEEWVNKTSGRGSISIGVDREDGNDPEELAVWRFLVGPRSYAEAVSKLFAWADIDVHQETYDEAEEERYEAEASFWDEGEQYFRETFDDWRAANVGAGIRPYKDGAGEVEYFRLELTLGALGKSFLVVDSFATDGDQQLTADNFRG